MDFFYIFGAPIVFCILMVLFLSYLGIHILKREAVFVDISLAQVAVAGWMIGHLLFHIKEDSIALYFVSFLLIMFVSFFYSLCKKYISEISIETIIGISYALSASLVLFLAGLHTGAHTHISEMFNGSVLWVGWKDVLISVLLYSVVGFLFFVYRKNFEKISDLYSKKENIVESKDMFWDFLFYVLLGIVIVFSVKKAGIILVFTMLILPGIGGVFYGSSWFFKWLYGILFGILSIFPGIFLSDKYDFSIGPSISVFCILIVSVALMIGVKKRKNKKY